MSCPTRTIILTLALVYILTTDRVTSTLAPLSRHFPNHSLYVDEQSFENLSLTYAVCKKSDEDKERTKVCQIYLENREFSGQTHTSSCNVSLNVEGDDHYVDEKFRVIHFGRDKSIVVTWESGEKKQSGDRVFNKDVFVKFSIVHFANCQVYEANVTIHNERQNLFNFEPIVVLAYQQSNTFDVAYFNERSCNEMFCKITYNAQGNRVAGPFPWFHYKPSTNLYLQSIHTSAPGTEHLLIESSEKLPTNQISLLKKNEIKILKFFDQSPYAIGYSTSYSTVGVCMEDYMDVSNRIRYSQIKCLQYDLDGNLLFETAKPVKFNNLFLSMHNLQNDRFLLLTKECSNEQCSNENFDYDVTKFNLQGKTSGFLKIKDFKCHHHSMKANAKFFESKSDEYCLSFVCMPGEETPEDKMYLDFTTKCFSDDDLMM